MWHLSANLVCEKRKGNLKKIKGGKKKYPHNPKICPIEGCFCVTKNIGEHLRSKIHGFDSSSDIYKKLLKDAQRFDSSLLPKEIIESPKKSYRVIKRKTDNFPLITFIEDMQNKSILTSIALK